MALYKNVPLLARPFPVLSWPQSPCAVAPFPFSGLLSQRAPPPSELESCGHIPLPPASDGIAVVPALGFYPADKLGKI